MNRIFVSGTLKGLFMQLPEVSRRVYAVFIEGNYTNEEFPEVILKLPSTADDSVTSFHTDRFEDVWWTADAPLLGS